MASVVWRETTVRLREGQSRVYIEVFLTARGIYPFLLHAQSMSQGRTAVLKYRNISTVDAARIRHDVKRQSSPELCLKWDHLNSNRTGSNDNYDLRKVRKQDLSRK